MSPVHSKQQQQQQQKQTNPRRSGMLSKMMDAAFHGDVTWNQVLHYIDSHCILDDSLDNRKLSYEAPLAASAIPTESLHQEIDYTLLKRAVLQSAPVRIVAAMVQLRPDLLVAKDAQHRTILHHACRYPPTEHNDAILVLLVAACRATLVQGDVAGRTPLQYLLWYHAGMRSNTAVIQKFVAKIPVTELDPALVEELKEFVETIVVKSKKQKQQSASSSSTFATPKAHNHHTTTTTTIRTLSATRIPDLRHGCFPIHYAVMGRVPLATLQVLLQADSATKLATDKQNRTALHWYLGAEYLPKVFVHDDVSSSHGGEDEVIDATKTHVSGEEMDPQSRPWQEEPLDEQVVRLLLSSGVARTVDESGRTPLHWAAHFWACHYYHSSAIVGVDATKDEADKVEGKRSTFSQADPPQQNTALPVPVVKTILDHHINQLTTQDARLMTPLMVLLDCTARLRQQEYLIKSKSRSDTSPRVGIECPSALNVPFDCIKLLLEHPDYSAPAPTSMAAIATATSANNSAGSEAHAVTASSSAGPHIVATLEDDEGRLPIHVALQVAAPVAVIQVLLESHPMSMLHATEEMVQVPLHCALNLEYTAPQQSKAVMELLLQSINVSKHGTVIDGRLALKMEDATGTYALHYACQNIAPVEVIEYIVQRYPQAALLQASNGNLAAHSLIDEHVLHMALSEIQQCTRAEKAALEVTRQTLTILLEPLLADPAKLRVADAKFGMLPLHLAVLFQAEPYRILLRMLQLYPAAAATFSTHPVHVFTCLDLHDICQANWRGLMDDWQLIRELLFAFGPLLESHRHREELLTRCVTLIVDEVRGLGSRHLTLSRTMEEVLPELELTHTLSNLVSPPITERRRNTSAPRIPSKLPTRSDTSQIFPRSASKDFDGRGSRDAMEKAEYSQYDDVDLSLGYDTAAVNCDLDDEDESYFSGDESSEEGLQSDGHTTDSFTDNQTNAQSLDTSYTEGELVGGKTSSNDDRSAMEPHYTLTVGSSALEYKFENAKRLTEEEKKSDDVRYYSPKSLSAQSVHFSPPPSWASEIVMRLWTLFTLYRNEKNPNDNYSKQVNDIIDQIEFPLVQELVSLRIPPYAASYIDFETREVDGIPRKLELLTFREVSNPKCRELLYKRCYFLGRFDFSSVDNALVKREIDDSCLVVRAHEWSFTTESSTDAANPGVSEATIWASGEVPVEVGLTFRPYKRVVLIKFTKIPEIYSNEISTRWRIDGTSKGCIVPIEHHYDGADPKTKEDRMYQIHIEDPRFRFLDFPLESCCIDLACFPYAVVYADVYQGNLADYVNRCGLSSNLAVKAAQDAAQALDVLHGDAIMNATLLPTSLVLSANGKNASALDQKWVLSDVSQCVSPRNSCPYLGGITVQGSILFSSATLPPEMFVKLSPSEFMVYRRYWQMVEKELAVTIPKHFTEPMYDTRTGESLVVKCHLVQQSQGDSRLPQLPYSLVSASRSTDFWAFGQLIFELCAGRPLFPYSSHTGQLFDYVAVCDWDSDSAKATIYRYVSDIAAQDLLIQLLSPSDKRAELQLCKIMDHPFFANFRPKLLEFEERRRLESAAYERRLAAEALEAIEHRDLKSRTTETMCWDIGILEQFHFSVTQLLRRLLQSQPWRETKVNIPCAAILLPYDPCRSMAEDASENFPKSARCQSEQLGVKLLRLTKALLFASRIQSALLSKENGMSEGIKFSSNDYWSVLKLRPGDFADVDDTLTSLASQHVELYRNDPAAIASMIVKSRTIDLTSVFDDCPLFLCLIDELIGMPVKGEHHPIEVAIASKQDAIQNLLLVTYLVATHARCWSNGLEGLSKLLRGCDGANVPDSWVVSARGLDHAFNETRLLEDINLLQDALTELDSSRHRLIDDVDFLRTFLSEQDARRNFCAMQRVCVAEMVLWTTEKGVKSILESAHASTFEQVVERFRSVGG